MNIYIHCEIVSRELDSKLLLGVLAALKGHQVLIADMETIEKGIYRNFLNPGIFHTKSLTPGKNKIERHSRYSNFGMKITSIDEEGGLTSENYNSMAKLRYSLETIDQSSAVFTWGDHDHETLKKKYPKYSSRIYKTGSPRADLWTPFFSEYWKSLLDIPKKPFLLISSNMNVCDYNFFHERIKEDIKGGYYERDPEYFYKRFQIKSNNITKAAEFIKAIRNLSKFNNGYDIVLRPHPIESIECWKTLLHGIPNVYVNREGAINSWVHNSFAVMHNGCTSALEATISKKPVITFLHDSFKYDKDFNFTNELGYVVKSEGDLTSKINEIFDELKSKSNKYLNLAVAPKVLNKLYLDDNELASYKMIKVWENLDNKTLSKKNNWTKFSWHLKKMKLNGFIGRGLNFFLNQKPFKKKENTKFPELNEKIIKFKIDKLIKILGKSQKLECKLLSDRAILVKLDN
jgi:surface carbohydrate biosynthesis protein